MIRPSLIIIYGLFLTALHSYGQRPDNASLLKSYGSWRVATALRTQEMLQENDWFGYEGDLGFFLIPNVGLKDVQHYTFDRKIGDFIAMEDMDTAFQVLVFSGDSLIAQMERLYLGSGDRVLFPPLFNARKRFGKLRKRVDLGHALVFSLPFSSQVWWVLQGERLSVFHKGRLKAADRFIHHHYGEREFIDLISP